MRNVIALFVTTLCLFFSSCHRPVAYFQRTPHPAASRASVATELPAVAVNELKLDSVAGSVQDISTVSEAVNPAVVSLKNQPAQSANTQVKHRMHRIQSLLSTPTESTDKQPDPRPKKKLKLGNQIRQSLGMKLRPELNWWQRISWKLKASIIVLLVAVVFAILHITILAIIFGIIGALLLISGLKKSFKVKRPWF